jgi:hypothetical protein
LHLLRSQHTTFFIEKSPFHLLINVPASSKICVEGLSFSSALISDKENTIVIVVILKEFLKKLKFDYGILSFITYITLASHFSHFQILL